MPRAGSGGGGHSSSGHHVSSHSSSGHHVSSSPRPSSSGGFHSGGPRPSSGPRPNSGPRPSSGPRPGGGFGGPTPPRPHITQMAPPPPRRSPRRSHFGYGRGYGSLGGGCLSSIITFFIVVCLIIVLASSCAASSIGSFFGSLSGSVNTQANKQITQSTVKREKINSGGSFDSNCIVDEIGWFENTKSAGKRLKTFYDKTGIQPYVVLLSYNSSLTTDEQKDAYADNYYDSHIDNNASFLFIYFAEENQDGDVGYMTCLHGSQTYEIIDDEALNIFWNYVDMYWDSTMSTDEMFEAVFTKTADRIMAVSQADSKSGFGKVLRNIILIVIVVVVAVFIVNKFKKKSDGGTASNSSDDAAKDNPNILN